MFPEFNKLHRLTYDELAARHTSADIAATSAELYAYEFDSRMLRLTVSAVEDAQDYSEPWSWAIVVRLPSGDFEALPTAFGYESQESAYEHARAVYLYVTGERAKGVCRPAMERLFTIEQL